MKGIKTASMQTTPEPQCFLSGDWGTSSFRLRLVQLRDGKVLSEIRREVGVKSLYLQSQGALNVSRDLLFGGFLAGECEALLRAALLGSIPLVLSGMATSSIGWVELPYACVPFPLDGSETVVERRDLITSTGWTIPCYLVSGIQTSDEMMRGEETELMGLFSMEGYRGLAQGCLAITPGTHSKHVRVQSGSIVSMRTFMTGELMDLLGRHSVLKATMDWQTVFDRGVGWSTDSQRQAFGDGVDRAKRFGLSSSLFQARTRGVLHGHSSEENVWYLMGLLIGEECLQLGNALPQDLPLVIAANSRFSALYKEAVVRLGRENPLYVVPSAIMDVVAMKGHRLLLRSILQREGARHGPE